MPSWMVEENIVIYYKKYIRSILNARGDGVLSNVNRLRKTNPKTDKSKHGSESTTESKQNFKKENRKPFAKFRTVL